MKYYAVFDTNVLISSMLTKNPESATAKVVNAISDRLITPLYNQEILDEYADVLHRAKFSFSKSAIESIIKMIKVFGQPVSPSSTGETLPDMDDLVFYEVVMEKNKKDDTYLITGNKKHFPNKAFIVTPAEMIKIIDKEL